MFGTVAAACGGGNGKTATTGPQETGVKANIIDSVISAYMRLKDAFFSDDGVRVNEAALALAASSSLPDSANLAGIPMKSTQMMLDICKKLNNTAQGIAAATSMDAKRRIFKTMIEPVRQVASTHTSKVLYVQYCPMAFHDSGAHWLSYRSEIRNPYYPKSMPKCGLVQDTLK